MVSVLTAMKRTPVTLSGTWEGGSQSFQLGSDAATAPGRVLCSVVTPEGPFSLCPRQQFLLELGLGAVSGQQLGETFHKASLSFQMHPLHLQSRWHRGNR